MLLKTKYRIADVNCHYHNLIETQDKSLGTAADNSQDPIFCAAPVTDTYWQEKFLRPIPSPSIASSPGGKGRQRLVAYDRSSLRKTSFGVLT